MFDIVQSSKIPHPRMVWREKVWTLRLGSDPPPSPSPYRSLDILSQKFEGTEFSLWIFLIGLGLVGETKVYMFWSMYVDQFQT